MLKIVPPKPVDPEAIPNLEVLPVGTVYSAKLFGTVRYRMIVNRTPGKGVLDFATMQVSTLDQFNAPVVEVFEGSSLVIEK